MFWYIYFLIYIYVSLFSQNGKLADFIVALCQKSSLEKGMEEK